MVSCLVYSESMRFSPGWMRSAKTVRAPAARKPEAKLSTRWTAMSWVGMSIPNSPLPAL